MKKVLSIVLTALVAMSLFAGGSQESASSDSGVIEITIPSYKTGENVGAVFFEPQVERFNAKYEGVYKINLEAVPQANFNDRIKQLAQQGQLPVLVQGGDLDWFANVAIPNGMAWDMSEWINSTPEVKDMMLADALEFCTTEDGAIYSFPLATIRPIGFFYNTALYNPSEDISKMSMDDWIASIGDQKIAFSTAENGWVAALFLTALIADEEGGGEWLQSGVDVKITDFNNEIMINAVSRLQDLLQNNASANSIGATYADAANAFMSMQASMISNGSWMSTDFEETNAANWSNGFDGADVRASLFPGNVGVANAATYGEWWISADASEDEIELAKAFLEFIYTPEELEGFLLAEGGSAPNLTYSESFLEAQGEVQVLADLAADTDSESRFVPCILDVIPQSVANVEFGKLLPSLADGSYSAEEFCNWMTEKALEATM